MPQFTSGTMSRYVGKWLIATGIFELLLGAGFAVGAITATSSLWLAAGILMSTGVALIYFGLRSRAKAEEAQRIGETGLPGRATIVGMTQTGVYMNEQPQIKLDLRVEVPGRPVFQAQHKEFVPFIFLNMLGIGNTLPVKVDPANTASMVIEWQQATPATGMPAMASMPGATQGMTPGTITPGMVGVTPGAAAGADESLAQVQQALEGSGMSAPKTYQTAEQGGYTVDQIRAFLRANGEDGWATINRFEDSGKTVGDERLFTMQATIEVPGKPPHQTPVTAALVPGSAFGKVAVGTRVPVKVAKDNPDAVVLEWERV